MEEPIRIAPGVFWVGVNDFRTERFEALWPLPEGISYNAYAIVDEKIAVVDTVKDAFAEEYLEKLARLVPPGRAVDYLVVQHMEPDHSGAIRALRRRYPQMQILGNAKTAELLKNFYGIAEGVRAVADGETVPLGQHALQFHATPMVHWPETMMTYDPAERILFSMDAFGGFGALTGGLFDDQVDLARAEYETLRYFANIVGRYSARVQQALQKLSKLEVRTIAPAHGPVYRRNPTYIVRKYDEWSRFQPQPGAVVVFASMYGNTEKMAQTVAHALGENGISPVLVHNVSRTHLSYLLADTWRYGAVALGSCTYNTRLFPLMELYVRSLEPALMQRRVVGLFGSCAWSGGALKSLRENAQNHRWPVEDPAVEVRGAPTPEDLQACRTLGQNIARKLMAQAAE